MKPQICLNAKQIELFGGLYGDTLCHYDVIETKPIPVPKSPIPPIKGNPWPPNKR